MINTLILLYAVIVVFILIIAFIEELDYYRHIHLTCKLIAKIIILIINFLMVTLLGGLKVNDNITMKGGMRYRNRTLLNSTGLSCLYVAIIIWYGFNLIYGIYRLYKIHNINNNQINSNSIKEGLDNLPSGVCFFDKYGKVILCNRKMHELGRRLIGSNVQNLMELENALNNPPKEVKLKRTSKEESGKMQLTMQYNSSDNATEEIYGENIYIFSENEIWIFAKEEVIIKDNERYSQILATNVTEIYKSMIQLDADNEKLKEDAKALNNLWDNMEEVAREKELLELKILIHNEMGACLTATRRILEGEIPKENIVAILDKWKETIAISNNETVGKSNLMKLREEVQNYGIEIIFIGKYPEIMEDEIICSSIRVCMNNAVKYAKANRLTIEVTKDIVNDESLYGKNAICYYNICIRNNGKQPDNDIIEGGGLSNIRRKIEEAGGYVKIQSRPEFIINIGLKTSDMGNA